MKISSTAIALLFGCLTASGAVADDVKPTPEQRAAIESALKAAGFSTWSDIELDDGKWEVDDAIHADGKRYDLDLSVGDLKIVKQKLDTD